MITVAISEELHKDLKSIKIHERESFNDAIRRIYEYYVSNEIDKVKK